ncbi:methyl-accepting chemotaxis protein [Agaribacter flavus]|uniref:Methyl-accepting chemotaxis protein n=1 Tax=Agaribacter flavus TaxID=1902781 RepID=A0ABV7FMN2_9ALTE
MQLTVVKKMVIGFALLAFLLVLTSALSYRGLTDIRTSAQSVAYNKLPVQQLVSKLNIDILRLGSLTTNAYYEFNEIRFSQLRAQFVQDNEAYQGSLNKLENRPDDIYLDSLNQILAASARYQSHSKAMLLAVSDKINTKAALQAAGEQALNHADEASALMLDISYLEDDSAEMETLIGMTTTIENKLGLMLSLIKELIGANKSESAEQIIADIEYNLSNVKVDADYAERLLANIEDDGIFSMYKAEFSNLMTLLNAEQGVFALKRNLLLSESKAFEARSAADEALNEAILHLSALSKDMEQGVLEGQENILHVVSNNVLKSAVASLAGIIATVLLAYIATRSIVKPLAKVNAKLRLVSQGDLTQTLYDEGTDEFSALAKNINQLIDSLHDLVSGINEKEQDLRAMMSNSIEIGDQSLQQVSAQQEKIQSSATLTQEIRERSTHNLNQILDADAKIEEVIAKSDEAVHLVNESNQQVIRRVEQSRASAQIVNRLGENTHKIAGILDVIKNIAEQTNLLALNAAIEAARAGEQGRGFAVVADEVRTLATKTQGSTKEIEAMMLNLQDDASTAISAMEEGARQAETGMESTTKVTEQIQSIKALINDLALVNQNVVADTKSQYGLLDEIGQGLDAVVALSNQSADSTEQSNTAMHEMNRQVEALNKAVARFVLR